MKKNYLKVILKILLVVGICLTIKHLIKCFKSDEYVEVEEDDDYYFDEEDLE